MGQGILIFRGGGVGQRVGGLWKVRSGNCSTNDILNMGVFHILEALRVYYFRPTFYFVTDVATNSL